MKTLAPVRTTHRPGHDSRDIWVSMAHLQNIVLATECGGDATATICRAAGITPEELANSDLRMSLVQCCAFVETAQALCGDAHMGLHVGQKTTPAVLGLTGHLMQCSKDVLSALQYAWDYAATFTRLFTYRITVGEDEVAIYCEPIAVWNEISPSTAQQCTDITFASLVHFLWLLTRRRFTPKSVFYRFARVPDVREYERILRCAPQFNHDKNCIVFHRADLARPVIGYSSELQELFVRILQEKLRREEGGMAFTREVKQCMLLHFQSDHAQLETVAARLHLTPRTLQRKLKEENTSFRALSNGLKRELACNLLTHDRLSIAEIAYRLGYVEPTAFQRAFRQWTGQPPHAFRQTVA